MQKFFIYCAGASYDTLAHATPAERSRVATMGSMVLIPTLLGIFSARFAACFSFLGLSAVLCRWRVQSVDPCRSDGSRLVCLQLRSVEARLVSQHRVHHAAKPVCHGDHGAPSSDAENQVLQERI